VYCVGSNDCVTGCPSGAKQSTIFTWLPRFWANGGALYTHCRAERLVTDHGRVTGVTGVIADHPGGRRFTVRARAVVLAGGAVQTPLLLLRSRLGGACGQVGRHFTIHPNVKVAARFDRPVDSVRGAHQAWQCVEFERDGILMAPGLVPVAFRSVAFNDFGPRLAQRMRDHGHVATGGILVDDHAAGRISLLPMGIPFVHYEVTEHDQARFVLGAARLAEIYFAAGAREVFLPFHAMPRLRSPDDLPKLLASKPRPEDTEYFTAHLMGSCRMDAHPRRGVVDPDGQLWDAPGLYIADASIMPSTIGVNPQVTIMALARVVAMKLADRLSARAAA